MGKIIPLNKKQNPSDSEDINKSITLDYKIKAWKFKNQKWWGNYTQILTVILDFVSIILVFLYSFNLIHLPIIELVFALGFRLALNRRIILKHLFNNNTS